MAKLPKDTNIPVTEPKESARTLIEAIDTRARSGRTIGMEGSGPEPGDELLPGEDEPCEGPGGGTGDGVDSDLPGNDIPENDPGTAEI